ncbi:MAG: YceD family protein [Granulosicoccaceae bacterium]
MGKPITSQIQPELLAREDTVYSVRVPLAQFKRLAKLLHDTQGDFTAECQFTAWHSHTKVYGQMQAELGLLCQRCLQAMTFKADAAFQLICVESEEKAEELGDELDPVLLDEDRKIRMVDLFEDEIILQLPVVSRHEEGDDNCKVGKMEFGKLPDNIKSEIRKPFEALEALKKDLKLKK